MHMENSNLSYCYATTNGVILSEHQRVEESTHCVQYCGIISAKILRLHFVSLRMTGFLVSLKLYDKLEFEIQNAKG